MDSLPGDPLATPKEKGLIGQLSLPQPALGRLTKAAEAAAKLKSWRRFILSGSGVRAHA
jgi:hypothetical protein